MNSTWSPYFCLSWSGDVDDRAADARLAELRRREQQRDRLLADDVLEVVSRAARAGGSRVSIDLMSPWRSATVSVSTTGALSPTSGIGLSLATSIGVGVAIVRAPVLLTTRTCHWPVASSSTVGRVDGGERVLLGGRLLGAVGGSVTSRSAGAANGPIASVFGRRAT